VCKHSVLRQRWRQIVGVQKLLTTLDVLWYNHEEERNKRRDEVVQPVGSHIDRDKG
jgi:hypothetical protein